MKSYSLDDELKSENDTNETEDYEERDYEPNQQ
jgi:hypothetical protein